MDRKLAEEIQQELLETFTPTTAYLAYVPFAQLMGGMHMEEILNSDIVWRLSSRASELSGVQSDLVSTIPLRYVALENKVICFYLREPIALSEAVSLSYCCSKVKT